MPNFREPEEINTIKDLVEEVNKVYLLADEWIIPVIIANIIGNRLNSDPFWLLIVAASSGGKTALIDMFLDLDFMHPVSDLTTNTFASGMIRGENSAPTSLLYTIDGGIMVMKEFTTILSKDAKQRTEIMAQMREVYDGRFNKKTGTGQNIDWKGKVGMLAAVTEVVYRYLEVLSAMGDRFVMYNMAQPDRKKATRRAFENSPHINEYRQHLQDCANHYIQNVLNFIDDNPEVLDKAIELDEETRDEILDIADFATLARSAVLTDFKTGRVDFVPTPEMPMRMAQQMQVVAAAFILMDRAENGTASAKQEADGKGPKIEYKLKDWHKKVILKIPFDSIPRTRRDMLVPLAQYKGGVTTAGLATKVGLPTESVKKYLIQVNALGLCTRRKSGGPYGDNWVLKEQYRQMILKLENIKVIDETLGGALGDNELDDDDFEEEWGSIGNDNYNDLDI